MKRFLVCALVLACGPSGPPDVGDEDAGDAASDVAVESGPTSAEQAAFDQLVQFTQTELQNSHVPGASIAIVLHGKLTFAAGVGKRNLTSGDPVTTSTLFRVASMSKMIVGTTAMSLVDQGKLDLGAPITQYLPWFSLANGYDASTVTTAALLTHTSGFPCDTIGICDSETSGDRKAFFQAYPQPLWASPGETWNYSNTGFALAAAVVEAAAGGAEGSYEQLAHDRVFVPAGMTTATFDATAAESGDHATGYTLSSNGTVQGVVEPTTLECVMLHPYGGVLATASDYAHFAEMILAGGGTTLSNASALELTGPHADMHAFASQSYGYGLIHQFSPYPDHASVWHDGSLPGYLSELWMVPDLGFAVVVLTNARGDSFDVPDDIIGTALSSFIQEARKVPPLTTTPSQWAGYLGTYDDDRATLGAGVAISLGDGGTTLVVDAPNAKDYSNNSLPVHGVMTQYAIDEWGMPDSFGTVATFFPANGATSDAGASKYFVTRRGTAGR
ncbi:MAG TPA: serine hydrolase domain-containing protein [Polyangiaceae bacterium]|nr:serine hydrolase domain-containing protein [Polyangiaceae bacterium]